MEAPLTDDDLDDERYHSASEHGLVWSVLNEMLHLIVFVYTLFGMIRFKVKFIHMVKLVNWISFIVIALSWFLTIKFASIAGIMYIFNLQLESMNTSLAQFNCSLSNDKLVFGGISQIDSDAQQQHVTDSVEDYRVLSFAGNTNLSLPEKETGKGQSTSINGSLMAAFNYIRSQGSQREREREAEADEGKGKGKKVKDLTLIDYLTTHSPLLLARLLDNIGGPYKLLGNQATLMYGFYSIAIFIMLAIFPIELMYHKIGFNYIRFVLNDTGCLRDFYEKKEKHLDRLNNWSRNKNSSLLTLSMKKTINQRNLRCLYVYDCDRVAKQMIVSHMILENRSPSNATHNPRRLNKQVITWASQQQQQLEKHYWTPEPIGPSTISQLAEFAAIIYEDSSSSSPMNMTDTTRLSEKTSLVAVGRAANNATASLLNPYSGKQQQQNRSRGKSSFSSSPPLKSLRHSLSTNHMDQPSFNVKVANKNLKKFKPFVRSESWFKLSMVFYPIFVFYYFTMLTLVIGAISIFFDNTLRMINDNCRREVDKNIDLFSNWSIYDQVTYTETHYITVFALSCASSFYCSYYFGTILELHVWISEIGQQLDLCKQVLQFTFEAPRSLYAPPLTQNYNIYRQHSSSSPSSLSTTITTTTTTQKQQQQQPFFGSSSFFDALSAYHNLDFDKVYPFYNQFGGIKSFWWHLKYHYFSQSERKKLRELMAIMLISRKQTLLRVTYLNLNLFFDELNNTRFMTKTILRRTTQIAIGFALMAAMTRSQFESNYLNLTILLGATLAILNLYLIFAASINSGVNKLLPQIHGVIGASIVAGTDHDLLEFWLRHIQAYGTDKDAMSYKIYGYKITWSSILNFNGAVSSAYLFTIY